MIEIKGNSSIQNSATVLAVSNYRESFVYITVIDLKMRRQQQTKKIPLEFKPTLLYQMDQDHLLIGTEGGRIEQWNISEGNQTQVRVYKAHPESAAAISAIIKLETTSELLRGTATDTSFQLIATASEGASQFRLWRLNVEQAELMPYLKIETTFTNGIKYLLETTDTQLAAANENTIKFYDFIDKNERDARELRAKKMEAVKQEMKTIFEEFDTEKTQKLTKEVTKKYLNELAVKLGHDHFKKAAKCSNEAFDDVWHEFGCDETGYLSWHSARDMVIKLLDNDKKISSQKGIEDVERQKRLDDFNRRKDEKLRRRAEKERAEMAELEGEKAA